MTALRAFMLVVGCWGSIMALWAVTDRYFHTRRPKPKD